MISQANTGLILYSQRVSEDICGILGVVPRLNHEDCNGLAGIGVWILEKQIILILTHGHRKVAVFFISFAVPKFVPLWRLPCFPSSGATYYRTYPESDM